MSSGSELSTPVERLLFATLAGSVAISWRLGAANVLLGLCLLGTVWRFREGLDQWRSARILGPLLLYVTMTVVAAVVSVEQGVSLIALKGLFTFTLVPLVLIRVRGPRSAGVILDAMSVSGAILGFWGVCQFALGMNDLAHRIRGPLSHYMTFSGVLLLVDLVTLARIGLGPGTRGLRMIQGLFVLVGSGLLSLAAFSGPDHRLSYGLLAALVVAALAIYAWRRPGWRRGWLLVIAAIPVTSALALSYTRNAWVGFLAGAIVILLAATPRSIFIFAPALLVSAALLPAPVLQRVQGTFDLSETSNYDRLCMIDAGLQMVAERPLLGFGPDVVRLRYPLFRRKDAPRFTVPHLHNNVLQIAAERGLIALAGYFGLLAVFFTSVMGSLRRSASREEKKDLVAPLAAVVGITVAGLFEANFQDTEVLLPTLFLLSLPFTREVPP